MMIECTFIILATPDDTSSIHAIKEKGGRSCRYMYLNDRLNRVCIHSDDR